MTPDAQAECCKFALVSYEWADRSGQNHRAHPGQAVCTGCGRGYVVTAEEYAALVAADAAYEERDRRERAGS